MYLIRLDDASEYMDIGKWSQLEKMLDMYEIKPITGVIPFNQDSALVEKYEYNADFWDLVATWQAKDWTIAMHGYNHVYETNCGGINPVNNYSEFAGVPLSQQREKIKKGLEIFQTNGIKPCCFFAPAHTFDRHTLEALRLESDIRIISDTVANDVYFKNGFYFIPQQCGRARKLPFKVVTFCYHPNTMSDSDFKHLEGFLQKNKSEFCTFQELSFEKRKLGLFDRMLSTAYFCFRKIRAFIK